MPKLTQVTKQAIEIINGHINDCKPRKRADNKNFPLWCALKSVKRHSSPIDAVLKGYARYPYSRQSDAKIIVAERIAKRYEITTLQFDLIENWLCSNGYYNNHYSAKMGEPPECVINVKARGLNCGITNWWRFVLNQTKNNIPLRAIVDQQLTDLILLKALEIAAFKSKKPLIEKEWHTYGM